MFSFSHLFTLPIKIREIVQFTFFFQPNFVFQCIFHNVETPGKFRNVKNIFELIYTGGVIVIVRRGWGLTSSKFEFPVLFSGIHLFPDSILTMFCIFTSLYIFQMQIYWSFPAIFYGALANERVWKLTNYIEYDSGHPKKNSGCTPSPRGGINRVFFRIKDGMSALS